MTQPERREGPAPRPRDAATLILYRQGQGGLQVLMGERHGGHAFMPNRYVFPGGRVDPHDWRVRAARPLKDDVRQKLERAASAARAHALAMAAVRETFEETGLVLGAPDPKPGQPVPPSWQPFFATGHAPALDCLEYVVRAVTPPYRPRRFNARFFIADASRAAGDLRGSGELLDLRWVTIDEALGLELPNITAVVLRRIAAFVSGPTRPTVAAFAWQRGKHVEFEE